MSIVALLVTLGAPTYIDINNERKLKGAVEASYFLLQQAKSQAVTLNSDITVDFIEGDNWCIGISDSGSCVCSTSNNCTVSDIETVLNSSDYSGVSMESLTFGDDDQTQFDSVRGISSGNSGSFVLTYSDIKTKLLLSNMGRVRICVSQGSLGTYQEC